MIVSKEKIKEEVDKRDAAIEAAISELESKLKSYQTKLYESVVGVFFDAEDVEDIFLDVERVLNEDKDFDKIVAWYQGKTKEIIALAAGYFLLFGKQRDTKIEASINTFVEEYTKILPSFKNDLRSFLASLSLSDGSRTSVRKSILKKVKGGEKQGYAMNKLFPTMRDTLTSVLRAVDAKYSDEDSLDYAYYLGGLIETSRCFCEQRNDLIWSRDKINSWNDLSWSGKIEGVDVKIALGGYNCRHYLTWLNEETATKYGFDEGYNASSCD